MDSLSPALAARSAVPAAAPVLARPLSPGESAHLDRLRDWLRGDGTDGSDTAALDARWDRLLATHPPHVPAPAGVAAAIGIAVGDLLVASVTDAVWMMCPGPEGATPGVLVLDRPHMPVLPVLDAHARWRVRSAGWTVDYVARAAAHLQQGHQPRVPTPHPSPDAGPSRVAVEDVAVHEIAVPEAPVDEVAVAEVPVDEAAVAEVDVPAPDDAPAPSAAWVPTLVADAGKDPEPAAWTPTFVEDTADAGPEQQDVGATDPEPAAWTPTLVEDVPEPAAWAPTFVEDTAGPDHGHQEPEAVAPVEAAWTPTFVEDTAEPQPEPAAWTPTFVVDAPEHVAEDAPEPVADQAEPAAWGPTPADTFPTPGRGMPVTPEQPLTPEDLPHRPSERVQDLALRALELALDRAVADVAGCAPFVLVREEYDVEVLDFPFSDAGVAQAREAARSGGYAAAAVAWTSPADASRPYPRVVVDASAPGRPGIRVAHSFAHDEHGSREIGGPQVVGQSAPVL
ncbi:hypothetical protein [Cellulomonas phragmiteti]|uniref:DUF3806 domain-containing protein n=1 Tax=Cellulomonas phragmiteti TaxID=478780 RepID=A0ABQ4DNE8_9CELL|nr:hypothetical protein [Cellulomonas phragmiteti]GIG40859.1 hypothetical protein Cph01nite_26210 [Cellulomonas phragmiteti]